MCWGKYVSHGITFRTVSRIFRLEPAERAEPEMLKRATPRSNARSLSFRKAVRPSVRLSLCPSVRHTHEL